MANKVLEAGRNSDIKVLHDMRQDSFADRVIRAF